MVTSLQKGHSSALHMLKVCMEAEHNSTREVSNSQTSLDPDGFRRAAPHLAAIWPRPTKLLHLHAWAVHKAQIALMNKYAETTAEQV